MERCVTMSCPQFMNTAHTKTSNIHSDTKQKHTQSKTKKIKLKAEINKIETKETIQSSMKQRDDSLRRSTERTSKYPN